MMNNEVNKYYHIDGSLLDGEKYFESLVATAYENQLLAKNEIERIQYECIKLLEYKTERYNQGGSSSIEIEIAKELMDSVFYTAGLYLKSFPNADDALSMLKTKSVEELYQGGRKLIDKMLFSVKAVHSRLIKTIIDTPNEFYYTTLVDGINGFFKLYYPEFFAHKSHITADYPLMNPVPRLCGIEFIRAYISNAYYENRFLSCFDTSCIHNLLSGYYKNYEELLVNLYEPVLCASLGCVAAGTDFLRLDITEEGLNRLSEEFCNRGENEIKDVLFHAFKTLEKRFNLQDSVINYIKCSINIVSQHIYSACGDISRVFKLPKKSDGQQKIVFVRGEKTDGENYRSILKKLNNCMFIDEKLSIIKNEIKSFEDMKDLLSDADLKDGEIREILSLLNPVELAVLYKDYCISQDECPYDLRYCENRLRDIIKAYFNNLSKEKQSEIIVLADIVTEE